MNNQVWLEKLCILYQAFILSTFDRLGIQSNYLLPWCKAIHGLSTSY